MLRDGRIESDRFRFDFAGQRKTLELYTNIDADISNVRLSFNNDDYNPVTGMDYNLFVYSIKTTDQVTGEVQFASTTDDNVYSEGVYRTSDGIVPGFGRGPNLFTNGFIEVRYPVASQTLMLDAEFGTDGQIASSTRNLVSHRETLRFATSSFGEITMHNFDGSADTSFGGDGTIDLVDLIGSRIGYGSNSQIQITDLDFFKDGSLLAVGTVQYDTSNFGEGLTPIIAKLTTSGQLDETYLNGVLNGTWLQLPTRTFAGPVRAAIGGDRAFVIGQSVDDLSDNNRLRNPNIIVSRLNGDGTLDPTFGAGGNVYFHNSEFPGGHAAVEGVINNRGKLVFATASVSFGSNVIRLNEDGSPDAGFATGGIYKTNPSGEFQLGGISAVNVEIDGLARIVLGGRDYTFTRLTADGILDTSFGTGGIATFRLDPPIELLSRQLTSFAVNDFEVLGNGIMIASTASLLIPGRAGFPPALESKGSLIVRLNDSGQIDSTFNGVGYQLIPTGAGGVDVVELEWDVTGRWYLSGLRFPSTQSLGSDPTVVRLQYS